MDVVSIPILFLLVVSTLQPMLQRDIRRCSVPKWRPSPFRRGSGE